MVNPVRSRPKSGSSFYLAPYCHVVHVIGHDITVTVAAVPWNELRERRVFFNGSIKDYIKWQNDNGGLPSVIINSLRIASSSALTTLGGALYGLFRVVPAWSPTDSDFTV